VHRWRRVDRRRRGCDRCHPPAAVPFVVLGLTVAPARRRPPRSHRRPTITIDAAAREQAAPASRGVGMSRFRSRRDPGLRCGDGIGAKTARTARIPWRLERHAASWRETNDNGVVGAAVIASRLLGLSQAAETTGRRGASGGRRPWPGARGDRRRCGAAPAPSPVGAVPNLEEARRSTTSAESPSSNRCGREPGHRSEPPCVMWPRCCTAAGSSSGGPFQAGGGLAVAVAAGGCAVAGAAIRCRARPRAACPNGAAPRSSFSPRRAGRSRAGDEQAAPSTFSAQRTPSRSGGEDDAAPSRTRMPAL
jgi:hypothetical protein